MKTFLQCAALIFLASTLAAAQSASPNPSPESQTAKPDSTAATGATASPAVPDSKSLEIIQEQVAGYPAEAAEKRIQGEVVVRVQVSETGNVEKIEVISGDPALVDAAIKAAKEFKFKPFYKGGKPVKASTKLSFDFYFNGSRPVVLPEGVTNGKVIRKVQPVYPAPAKGSGIQGSVVLNAVIGKDGHVKSLTPVSGHPQLLASAMDAVKQWRYEPFLLNGEPVEVETQVTVNFRLAY